MKWVPTKIQKQHSTASTSSETSNSAVDSSHHSSKDVLKDKPTHLSKYSTTTEATSGSQTNESQTKPIIVNHAGDKKPPISGQSLLTRSTPGKSASFKQQPTSQKKPNVISTFASNLLKKPTHVFN